MLLESFPKQAPDARCLIMYQLRFEAGEGGPGKAYLIPVFEKGLGDAEPDVRVHSVLALREIGSPLASDFLVAALDHPDADVRAYAAGGLRDLGIKLKEVKAKALEPLRRALNRPGEPDYDVRLAIAHALVHLGERLDGSVFIEGLKRKEANWALASDGLATLGRKDTILLLIRRLKSRTFNPRYMADALEKMTGHSFGLDWNAWTAWYRKNASRLPPQVE
jgi:HEAT repeat protein